MPDVSNALIGAIISLAYVGAAWITVYAFSNHRFKRLEKRIEHLESLQSVRHPSVQEFIDHIEE